MLIFIPMAGFGDRYIKAGYVEPKPLILVDGVPMIERVIAGFRAGVPDAKFLFCINAKHAALPAVREALERAAPGSPVIVIDPHKDGPVRTLIDCEAHIPDGEDVVLNYCDFGADWSFAEFRAWIAERGWDGAMTAYRGFHPHSLGPTLYAYMRNEGERVTEIREKHHFTPNKLEEYASSGLYYFKSGAEMKRLAHELVRRGERVNGEFYVSMMMQLLIEGGGKVGVHPLRHFYQWGTPEDLRDFESWLLAMRRFPAFAEEAAKFPSRAVQVIPMAGRGQRFVDQGYAEPKPFIPVGGEPMIARALACLPKPVRGERNLVVQREHAESERFRGMAASLGGRVITLDRITDGQACTALIGLEGVSDDDPVLFAPCDAGYVYDPAARQRLEEDGQYDAIVWTARGHLPAIWRPQMYGWVEVEGVRVRRAAVKEVVPGAAPSAQEVMTGTFWFRDAATFRREEKAMEAANDRVNGEFHIDTIIKRMVAAGAKVAAFTVDKYIPWGTPEELRTFDYYAEVTKLFEPRAP